MKKTLLSCLLLIAQSSTADVIEFGGHDQRFKGNGDNTPPHCNIELPKGSTTPFFILWECDDDVSKQDAIRTELWLTRNNGGVPVLLNSFLGFPAAVQIDEQALQVTNFVDGLPIQVRLIAKDQAGNAATSETFTIRDQDVSVDNCDLTIATAATESTSETTGLPAMNVIMDNVDVSVAETSSTNFSIRTKGETPSTTCEIDSLCSDKEELTFSIAVTLDSTGNATGTLAISPGDVSVKLSGDSTTSSSTLTQLDMSGETTIEGTEATVTFVCSQ